MSSDDLEHSHHPREIAQRLRGGPPARYLRDWVYGGIDGAVTTFAIMAGVVGAKLSPGVVLILGAANLLADGLSMAAANYSSTRTEIDEYDYVRNMEERHVRLAPEGEREELRQILKGMGFKGQALDEAVGLITRQHERWIDIMMTEEHGMPPVNRSPLKAAMVTFLAFVVCGAVPLLPYIFLNGTPTAPATVLTAVVFFSIGSLRARWSPTPWWRAGLETLAIGMAAAGIAFLVGFLLQGLARG
jgi:vacuolar iron transporter family protein